MCRARRALPRPRAAIPAPILKILGRGALLLVTGAFDLTLWLFGALLTLFGILCWIKSTTERATQAWLRPQKGARGCAARMAASGCRCA